MLLTGVLWVFSWNCAVRQHVTWHSNIWLHTRCRCYMTYRELGDHWVLSYVYRNHHWNYITCSHFLSFEICLPMHVSMPYKFLVNTVGCLTCRCQNVYSGYEKSAIQEAWHNTFLVSWLECLQLSHDIRENGDKKELKLWRHHLSINSYYSRLSAKKRKLNQKLTNNTRNSRSQPILSLNGAPLFLQQPWLATQHLASRIVRYCDLPFGSSVQKCQGWCHLRCGPEDTAFCYQYLPQTSIYADCWGTQSPVVYARSQRRLSPTMSDRMASGGPVAAATGVKAFVRIRSLRAITYPCNKLNC